MAIDFGDIASRYATARLDQATQPFTDPEAYANNRLMQNFGVDMTGNTRPVTTTIRHGDAETPTTVTTKSEVAPAYAGPGIGEGAYTAPAAPMAQAALAAQPAPQPQVQQQPVQQAAPVANVDNLAIEEQRRKQLEQAQLAQVQAQQAQQMATPPAAPVVPDQSAAETQRLMAQNAAAAPVSPEQAAVNQVNATQLPQPGPGVQVAGGPAGTGVAEAAKAATPVTVLNPDEQHQQAIVAAHNEKDPVARRQKFAQLAATEGVSEGNRQLAHQYMAEEYLNDKQVKKAEQKVATATPLDIQRYMKDKSVEGSYVKAILFARLGLNDLARQEQEKINPSVAMGSEIGADGQRYSVVRNKEGFITKAFDTTGAEATPDKVAELSASAMATKGNIGHAGATRVRDSKGNEWSVVPTTRGSQFYDNTGKPGVPEGKTVPITVGGDVGLQRELAVNRAKIAVEGKKGAEAISVLGDLNKKNQVEGLPTVSYDDIGMNDRGEFVAGRPGQPAVAQTTATTGVPKFKDASIEIISAQRPTAEQQSMYDAAKPDLAKDPSGQTRYNAAGNPVARPGTSAHEGPEGNAFDVNAKKLTRSGRAELAAQGYYQPIPQQDPNHWERLPGAAPAGATTTAQPAGGVAEVTRQREQAQQVGTAEQKEYVQHKNTVQDASDAGRKVAQITRAQTSDLMNDPAIIGIMNGSGTQNAAAGKLLREMASGAYAGDGDNGKRLADDIRGLSIPQPQKDALSRYAQMNTSINSATLKSNVGAGSVSNAEQTMNQRANMTNIGDLTPFAALNGLGRREFTGGLAQEKANMINTGQYKTRAEFEQAWSRVEEQRVKQYESVYKGRLDLIKPFAETATKNPNDAVAQQRYRDAAVHAFRVYPNPEYTPGSGWSYKTKESKMAAMAAAAGER